MYEKYYTLESISSINCENHCNRKQNMDNYFMLTEFALRYRHSVFTYLLSQYCQHKPYNYFMFQNRLLESLAKFQEYEDTLESIMRNLDDFEPVINEEVETPVNLKLAQQQLETARVMSLPITVTEVWT